jgi:hypothetical protein
LAARPAQREFVAEALFTIITMFTNLLSVTMFTTSCYTPHMKRATMTLPDDLAEAVDNYLRAQEAPPALTTVVQAALREYLSERGFLRVRKTLKISPKGNSGRSDVSENHDAYLAGVKK